MSMSVVLVKFLPVLYPRIVTKKGFLLSDLLSGSSVIDSFDREADILSGKCVRREGHLRRGS